MRQRRVKSIKDELVKKSREALLAAVQIYNNPQIQFKAETFITHAIIGWTYLMHAFLRSNNIDYRYCSEKNGRKTYLRTKHGAYRHWDLECCLQDQTCPLDNETKLNLRFLMGLRHEIEHQMTDKIDQYLCAKLQACVLNYDYYIGELFGQAQRISNEAGLVIQFSPISPDQTKQLLNNKQLLPNICNYITEFESELSLDEVRNTRYAYRLIFTPIGARKIGQADKVVQFIRADSPQAEGKNPQYTLIKETEKPKYLPSEIVRIMKEEGYAWFSISIHTDIWKKYDAKDPKFSYGVKVSKSWYWYDNWLHEVRKFCESRGRI